MDNADRQHAEDRGNSDYRALIRRRRWDLEGQLASILTRPGAFTWEVGAGHGHFLTAYAQTHPHQLCIGIDIVSERIERALRKRDRARLENLFFVHAEARLFLECLPSGTQFNELFILFPDPWPKLRHHKHRILQSDFLSRSARAASSDCRLCFRTDHEPYFEDARQSIDAHPSWTLTDEAWPFEFTTVFQSRAEAHRSLLARHVTPQPGP